MTVAEIIKDLNIGVSKEPLTDAVHIVLDSWSKLAMEAVRSELLKKSLSQSGTLAQEIIPLPIEVNGSRYTIEITGTDAVEYADQGVSGTEQSYPTPFSFKHPTPSQAHVDAILKWIPNAGLTASHPDGYASMAWGIATNVKKKGLEPKNFMSAGFDEESEQELGRALSIAIGRAIDVKFNRVANKYNK